VAPVMARHRGIGDLGSAESTSTNTRPPNDVRDAEKSGER